MSTLLASDPAVEDETVESVPETLADLVHRLGDIPLERIRMKPAPGTAVEEDVITRKLCELIEGVIVEKAMSYFESRLGAVLLFYIQAYLLKTRLGFVLGADAQTRMAPGLIRIPDVSYASWERTSGRKVPTDPIGPFPPDLAVEILSPGNTKREMAIKRHDYFAAGIKLVWLVDPKSKSVSVYRSEDNCRVIQADGTIDGEDVLPGFSLSIKEWFQLAAGDEQK